MDAPFRRRLVPYLAFCGMARTVPIRARKAPLRCWASSSSQSAETLRKTALYNVHMAHGAKMVPFGGFHMPVQYAGQSVGESHHFVRTRAGLFDVGHMVQRVFSGPGASGLLARLTPSDVAGLAPHTGTLSCLMTSDGSAGIVDDTIITALGGGRFYVVTNAGCRAKDDAYLAAELAKWNAEPGHEALQAVHEELVGHGLVALQGPEAETILRHVLDGEPAVDLRALSFGRSIYARMRLPDGQRSSPLLVARGGYTGEDGFEMSVPGPEETTAVTQALLTAGGPDRLRLAGLGARDSLRLEAGLCLYGHDLDETTTPAEAALGWIVPKTRRTADAGYYGAEVLAAQLVPQTKGGRGVARRRVGLVVDGAPAREGAELHAPGHHGPVGSVTSGCPSPTLAKNIAMAYVKDGFHKAGTELEVLVRAKKRRAVVTKMPFVPTKYWKGPGVTTA